MPHFPPVLRELPKFAGPFDAFKLPAKDCDVLFASYPAGTTIRPHDHETENVGVITQGELILAVDGKESRYGPGDWYHVPARVEHAARFEKETSEIEFWFTPRGPVQQHPNDDRSLSVNPVIASLVAGDRARWEVLARGYKAFYKTPAADEEYERTWTRLQQRDNVLGIGAKVDGELVGIAHYLFHTTVWAPTACYLQDLFVAPEVRGKGIARALIEAVARHAREAHATRFYWLTQDYNTVARILYDKVAKFNGFIRYEFPL